jgi:hypothetical protein
MAPMKRYINLDLESLIDILILRIKEYDRMLSTRVFSEEEFAQCKLTLAELHAAIKEKARLKGFNTDNIFPNFPLFAPPAKNRSSSHHARKKASRKH